MIGVKNLVADERDPKPYLTREQIQKLCVEAANHSRDIYLFVCLCAYAGLRAAEALNCTWAWMQLSQPEEGSLKFYGGSITVQSGHKFRVKARQARTIPLHDTLRTVLENIEPKTGYLIKPEIVEWAGEDRWTYRKPLDTVLDRCGLKFVDNGKGAKRVGAHVLRHTFCSMLAQIGRSTYEIMQWAGHSDIKVSEGYMHLAPHKAGLSW
jgi:integrase